MNSYRVSLIEEQWGIIKNNEVKNPKTTICVVVCVIYNNIMHLMIILTTKIKLEAPRSLYSSPGYNNISQ